MQDMYEGEGLYSSLMKLLVNAMLIHVVGS